MNQPSALVTIHLRGSDAGDFLQGYVTCDTSSLHDDAALPMCFPDRQGRIVANGWLHGCSDDVAIVVHVSTIDILKSHLKMYLQFSKSLFDPKIQPCAFLDMNADSSVKIEGLQSWLVAKEQSEGECFRMLVDMDQPLVTSTTSGKFLPHMLNLEETGAINFDKGCYLGQEVIARTQHRGQVKRRLHKFVVTSGQVRCGDIVEDDQAKRGEVILASSTHALIVMTSDARHVFNPQAELELAA